MASCKLRDTHRKTRGVYNECQWEGTHLHDGGGGFELRSEGWAGVGKLGGPMRTFPERERFPGPNDKKTACGELRGVGVGPAQTVSGGG